MTPRDVVDPWSLRPVVGKYKILSGVHSEGAVPGTYRVDPGGTPMCAPRVYNPGDVVASRSDLLKHNPVRGEKRFERVEDSAPDKYDGVPDGASVAGEELESMTVQQLKQLADAEGIDLGDFTRKSEIISWIHASRGESE